MEAFTPKYSRMVGPLGFQSSRLLLTHYTSFASLESILRSNSILATEARTLADTEEIRFGFEVARNVIQQELDCLDEKSQDLAERSYHGCLSIGLAEMNLVAARETDAFLTCFCDVEDHQPVQDKFGDYQLKFTFDAAPNLGLSCGIRCRALFLAPVLYELEEQRDNLRKVLLKVKEVCAHYAQSGITMITDSLLNQALFPGIYMFKRPEFRDEREWRLILLPEMDDWWVKYASTEGIVTISSLGKERKAVRITKKPILPIKQIQCPTDGKLAVRRLVNQFGLEIEVI